MANTGPVPGVLRNGHPIAKFNVIALNVRHVDWFRALLIHPTSATPPLQPPDENTRHEADGSSSAEKVIAFSDANMGQLNEA